LTAKWKSLHLGFDIDGVIANFATPFTEIVNKKYGVALNPADIYTFDLSLILGIPKEERNQIITETLQQQNLPLNTGAKEILNRLHNEGHKIYLLTARFPSLIELTNKWLNANEIPYKQLLLLNGGEKYLAKIDPLDLVVEDSLEEALLWSQKVPNVLLYNQPWNKTLNVKNLTKRVYGWGQIYREVHRLSALNHDTVSREPGEVDWGEPPDDC
jgi:uncharacterized HAD superfamily protein